jgi:hypothetical protein
MLKVLGEEYFVDFQKIEEIITIKQETTGDTEQNISIVKFELIKTMLDVLFTESTELDDKMLMKGSNDVTIPFKIAFNTLIRYNILQSF